MSGQSAQSIQTLSEFLLHAGTDFQLFDLGRGVHPLDTQQFLEMESGMRPCPRPRQQHAWFGIVFWSGKPVKHHYIWFLKFPVDERGLLVMAARNHFLQIIVDVLGSSPENEKQDTLPDNPYSFVPVQSQMAQFNALTRNMLGLPAAPGTDKVAQYVKAPAVSDWRELSVQAIADYATTLTSDDAVTAVITNLSLFQQDFVKTLMESCEPVDLAPTLKQAIAVYCQETLIENPVTGLAALRALASETADKTVTALLKDLLNGEQADIHLLSVIAGRHYAQLDETLLVRFFENAAAMDDKENRQGAVFGGFFSDLVQLPVLRLQVLTLLRTDTCSEKLKLAFGRLFNQAQKQ
ncbi:DUF3549 family protein [Alteromonas sp. RKMC-009]|uniref:DUF3549 family protein n=1 Tax=Alteromonas sp. RKMC-009 TaxID=2267264 RepID=UPI000E6A1DFD|nr:DUF3549 family protein [Alteromonas sp. RKMC-009]AYA66493.1 DUF3549 family protein [Alteromonas sp. RKMC-009]